MYVVISHAYAHSSALYEETTVLGSSKILSLDTCTGNVVMLIGSRVTFPLAVFLFRLLADLNMSLLVIDPRKYQSTAQNLVDPRFDIGDLGSALYFRH